MVSPMETPVNPPFPSPDLVIRPADSADAAVVAAIDARADPTLRGGERRARVARELIAMGKSWIAEWAGAKAGYVLASRRFFDRPFVELLVVDPAFRRRGIAEALLARCEAAHNDDRIFISTNASNAAMRALLAKAGFEASGEIHNLDPGDPELVFVRFRAPA
jgi:ribosomal protein S18 acetylase RimI-like enzyme